MNCMGKCAKPSLIRKELPQKAATCSPSIDSGPMWINDALLPEFSVAANPVSLIPSHGLQMTLFLSASIAVYRPQAEFSGDRSDGKFGVSAVEVSLFQVAYKCRRQLSGSDPTHMQNSCIYVEFRI
jgi:hypothetical protein